MNFQTKLIIVLAAIAFLILFPDIRNGIVFESLAYLILNLGIIIFAIVIIVSFIINRQVPQQKILLTVLILSIPHALFLYIQSVVYYSTPGLFNSLNSGQSIIANIFAALSGICYPLAAAVAGISLRKILKLPQK